MSQEEKVSAVTTWKQTFTIDRYGNRRFDAANTTTLGSCTEAVCNPTVSTSNNRISSSGYTFDANGNVTQDAQGRQFLYDAENHQTEVKAHLNNTIGEYLYDGEGKRVKKISATETTIFVYNAGGQLVAEYSTQISQTPQVSYLTTDHLGSPRVITDQDGNVSNRKDYTAFGEENYTAQRTEGLGYLPADVRKGYTGYEKDDESGLDFAQARYYNSGHGRYTSVDPLTASASIRNPQTFNRYSYVLNSPYKYTDPLGLMEECRTCSASGMSTQSIDKHRADEDERRKKEEEERRRREALKRQQQTQPPPPPTPTAEQNAATRITAVLPPACSSGHMCFGPDSEIISVSMTYEQPENRFNQGSPGNLTSGVQGTIYMSFEMGGQQVTRVSGWNFTEKIEVINASGAGVVQREGPVPFTNNTQLIDDLGPIAPHPDPYTPSQLMNQFNNVTEWNSVVRQTITIAMPGGTSRSFTNTRHMTNKNSDGSFLQVNSSRNNNYVLKVSHSKNNQRAGNSKRNQSKIEDDKRTQIDNEREILRNGILAEYELKFRRERIEFLIEHRDRLKFTLTDPTIGVKHKVSLRELERETPNSDDSPTLRQQAQIKAITHNILAKEELAFFKLEEDTALVRTNAKKIRADHKKRGTKLPTPAFRKVELDELQDQCLSTSRTRDFLFLEQIRISLEQNVEIAPRSHSNLENLAAKKVRAEMKAVLHKKQYADLRDNAYYRKVRVGNDLVSLAIIDRETNSNRTLFQAMRSAIETLTAPAKKSSSKSKDQSLKSAVENILREQLAGKIKDLKSSKKIVGVLSEVLDRRAERTNVVPRFSADELIEVEALSRNLKLPTEYKRYWEIQKNSMDDPKKHRNSSDRTNVDTGHSIGSDPENRLLAGRTLAREILCNIGLNKEKEEIAHFRKAKRFHKFAIEDKKSGSMIFLSLNDVDLSPRASVLDHALYRLLEGKNHKLLRREVEQRAAARERNLKSDLATAKVLSLHARTEAAEFKQFSLWSNDSETSPQPTFTTREIFEVEKRIESTPNKREAKRLSSILLQSAKEPSESYNQLLSEYFVRKENAEHSIPRDATNVQKREVNEGLKIPKRSDPVITFER